MSARVEQQSRWLVSRPMLFATSGFVLMTVVAVCQFLRVIESFTTIFKDLGVRTPLLTEVVLSPWTHAISGVALLTIVGLRHRHGWKEWATAAWVVALLTYITISHVGLFEPLIRLISQLGTSSVS